MYRYNFVEKYMFSFIITEFNLCKWNHEIFFWCIINSKFIGIETFGKNAVVCGRSKNVGMPMAVLLHADGIGETKAGIII